MFNPIKLIRLKTGLAFKLIISIFASITLVFIVMFMYNYKISTGIVKKNLNTNAENLTKSAVSQIEKILYSIQKIPDNYSKIIENKDYSKDVLLNLLKQEVEVNPEIYGGAIAFEPFLFAI